MEPNQAQDAPANATQAYFVLELLTHPHTRVPVTKDKTRVGRYTCQVSDTRLSRNQAEVWSDGRHCFFHQIGVNPCAIKPSGKTVGTVAGSGLDDQHLDEIPMAFWPPEIRGCVRTNTNLTYVLDQDSIVYLLSTSEAEVAPFKVVRLVGSPSVASTPPKMNLFQQQLQQQSPQSSPATASPGVSRENTVNLKITPPNGPNFGLNSRVRPREEAFDVNVDVTPVKRPKLSIDLVAENQNHLNASSQGAQMNALAPASGTSQDDLVSTLREFCPDIPESAIRRAIQKLPNATPDLIANELILNPDTYMDSEITNAHNADTDDQIRIEEVDDMEMNTQPSLLSPPQPTSSSSAAAAASTSPAPVPGREVVTILSDSDEQAGYNEFAFNKLASTAAGADQMVNDPEEEARLKLEEEDRLLAEKMYQEELEFIKNQEEDRKKVTEFDSAFQLMREQWNQESEAKQRQMQEQMQILQSKALILEQQIQEQQQARLQQQQQPRAGSAGSVAVVLKEVSFPDYWNIEAMTQHTHVTVQLDPNSDEFKRVAVQFLQSCINQPVCLRSISRNQCVKLWNWYYLKREEIAMNNETGHPDNPSNERLLFHGTSPANISTILLDGLDIRVANMNGAIGAGIYFAEQAHVSLSYLARPGVAGYIGPAGFGFGAQAPPQQAPGFGVQFPPAPSNFDPFAQNPNAAAAPFGMNQQQQAQDVGWMWQNGQAAFVQRARRGGDLHKMLLCRVALGATTQGHNGLRRPPPRNNGRLFDAVSGSLSGSVTFCIFDNHQSYPEYLIEFDM